MSYSLAYIAGLFDGEGTVHVAVHKGGSATSYVRVVNTNEEVISYVNKLMPGYIWVRTKQVGCKPLFTLTWYGRNAVDVLNLLFPYLIIKKEAAQLLIDFYDDCVEGRQGIAISDAEEILRNSYKCRLNSINRRGI